MMNKIVNTFIKKPSLLFLTDAIGAFTTSFLLFVVLRNLDTYFSMPDAILKVLAAVAAVFFIYSISCFFLLKEKWAFFIKIIMVLNMLYCLTTLGILMLNYSALTLFDLLHFLGEIMIISTLVVIEFRTSLALSK
jgi:ABC-type long-subunit fatty acid transport system fused permease/ATPase subunit